MRTRIDFVASRLEEFLGEPGDCRAAGTDVTVTWNEYPADNPDMVTGDRGTPTQKTEVIKALLHFVGPSSASVRQFNEVETGDLILEYSPQVVLEGRAEIRFLIEGGEWSVKPLSSHLKETWDAIFAGRRLFKALLLQRSTG